MRFVLAAAAAILALTACKAEMFAEVYLSDLEAAIEGKDLMAPARLSVEMPAKKTCEEKMAEATTLLGGYFLNPRDGQCRTAGFNAFLDLTIDLPILTAEVGAESMPIGTGSIVALVAQKHEDGAIDLSLTANREALAQARDAGQRKYMTTVELDETAVTIALNNDLRGDATVLVASGFANGQPVPFRHEVTMPRRETLQFRLSDVAAASLFEYGMVTPAALLAPKS
jgi:hypothetical protein